MENTGVVVGIDACPAGWAVCSLTDAGDSSFSVIKHAAGLLPLIERCDLACIDIPIGIPEDAERDVDRRAKSILGRYHARVFMTPPRVVVDQPDYACANAKSRRVIGKGLSKQAWNILPKVRAIDELLIAQPGLRDRVRECHPEIALWGMGGRVIGSNKQTTEGQRDRLGVLDRYLTNPGDALAAARASILKRDAKDDDLIDAMICAATAGGLWDQSIRTLAEHPVVDERGIEIGMCYRAPTDRD